MHWQSRAACGSAQAGLFFGSDGETEPDRRIREVKAKAICALCPVRMECLDYALQHHVPRGIWGGLNERERFREQVRQVRRASTAQR